MRHVRAREKGTMAQGFFVISDITGYTQFLNRSELEHAGGIINGLLKEIADGIAAPLQISNLQGDAIFSYAPAERVALGQTLLHQIDNIYFRFKDHLHKMHINTTCTCRACGNIESLDLKFFVHYGEYIEQQIADRTELTGTDVIVVHRLMKNDVQERTGKTAYALYTQQAAERLNLAEFCKQLIPHEHTMEEIGSVKAFVYCMHQAYAKQLQSDKHRVTVDGMEPYVRVERELAAPPNIVWEYMTRPDLKQEWLMMNKVGHEFKSGAKTYGVGSKYHCVHVTGDFRYEVLDYRPFQYLTVDGVMGNGFAYRQMEVLRPNGSGTVYTVHLVPRRTGFLQNFRNRRLARGSKQFIQDVVVATRDKLAELLSGYR